MRPITGGTTNSPPYASTEISEAGAAEKKRYNRRKPGSRKRKSRQAENGIITKTEHQARGRRSETAARHQHPLCEAPPQELADETADNGSGRKGGKGRCRRIQPGTFCHQK